MTPPQLPPWPASPPRAGDVWLRAVTEADMEMAAELATDPYVPQIGSLPARASVDELRSWVQRQQQRYTDGAGYSFTIVDAQTGTAVWTLRPLAL